jgi:site-specific DNA-methyltransferase (adenine-specific)
MRQYIGSDISLDAIKLSEKRLINPFKTESLVLKKGYSSYLEKNDELVSILESINAKIVQRNTNIDGIINSIKYKYIPIKIKDDRDLMIIIQSVARATKKKNLSYAILIIPEPLKDIEKNYLIDGVLVNIVDKKDLFESVAGI